MAITSVLAKFGIKHSGNQAGKGTSKANSQSLSLFEYLEQSKDIQSNKVRIKYAKTSSLSWEKLFQVNV